MLTGYKAKPSKEHSHLHCCLLSYVLYKNGGHYKVHIAGYCWEGEWRDTQVGKVVWQGVQDCSSFRILNLLRSLRMACIHGKSVCQNASPAVGWHNSSVRHCLSFGSGKLKPIHVCAWFLLSLKMLLGWRMSLCSFHCQLSHCICFGTDLKFCLTSWLL